VSERTESNTLERTHKLAKRGSGDEQMHRIEHKRRTHKLTTADNDRLAVVILSGNLHGNMISYHVVLHVVLQKIILYFNHAGRPHRPPYRCVEPLIIT
jgi:hypothetical protein